MSKRTKEVCLCDASFLLPFFWPSHSDHSKARNWYQRNPITLAVSPLCELGFLRLSMSLFRCDYETAAELIRSCERFLPDKFRPVEQLAQLPVQGHKQLNDIYLAELARENKMRFVTIDKRINHPSVWLVE